MADAPATAEAVPKPLPPTGSKVTSPQPEMNFVEGKEGQPAAPAKSSKKSVSPKQSAQHPPPPKPSPKASPKRKKAAPKSSVSTTKKTEGLVAPSTGRVSTAGKVGGESVATNGASPAGGGQPQVGGKMRCECGEMLALYATRRTFSHLRSCKGRIKRQAHERAQERGVQQQKNMERMVVHDTAPPEDENADAHPSTPLPLAASGGVRFAADTSHAFSDIYEHIVRRGGLPISNPSTTMWDFPVVSDYSLLAADQRVQAAGEGCIALERAEVVTEMTRPEIISILRSYPQRDALGLTFKASEEGNPEKECAHVKIVCDGRKADIRKPGSRGGAITPPSPSSGVPHQDDSAKDLSTPVKQTPNSRSWRGHTACPRVSRCRWEYLNDEYHNATKPVAADEE